MDEQKLRGLWGDALYDYAYQKSQELIGYPDYLVMCMAAIGKLKDQGVFIFSTDIKSV